MRQQAVDDAAVRHEVSPTPRRALERDLVDDRGHRTVGDEANGWPSTPSGGSVSRFPARTTAYTGQPVSRWTSRSVTAEPVTRSQSADAMTA